MTWPTVFGNLLGGNQPLSLIDGMFQQTAQMLEVPCSASGATAISLTPLVNCPVLTGYTEFCAGRFRAAANSGAGVTAQINGIGFLPVYKADGVTQAAANDLVIGFEYVVRFSQALGGGVGGWFLEAPAVGSGGGGGGTGFSTPGGRLTLQAGIPVMTSSRISQVVYYVPYVSQFAQLWNGATLQPYNFCSSLGDTAGLSLNMAGSANWPTGSAHDLFVTLNGGVPTLATVQWTTVLPPARSIGLALFGGQLTNASSVTMQINPTTTIPVAPNQGTFLGSVYIHSNGTSAFTYGDAASGGVRAQFNICNYYNKVSFNTTVTDNGGPYTYTGAIRQARASLGNAITYFQSDSERTATFQYAVAMTNAAVIGAGGFCGIGINTTTAFVNGGFGVRNVAAQAQSLSGMVTAAVNSTGLMAIAACEFGDGANANSFNANANALGGQIWL